LARSLALGLGQKIPPIRAIPCNVQRGALEIGQQIDAWLHTEENRRGKLCEIHFHYEWPNGAAYKCGSRFAIAGHWRWRLGLVIQLGRPNHGFSFLSHRRLSFFSQWLLLPLIDGLNADIQWAKFDAGNGDYYDQLGIGQS